MNASLTDCRVPFAQQLIELRDQQADAPGGVQRLGIPGARVDGGGRAAALGGDQTWSWCHPTGMALGTQLDETPHAPAVTNCHHLHPPLSVPQAELVPPHCDCHVAPAACSQRQALCAAEHRTVEGRRG